MIDSLHGLTRKSLVSVLLEKPSTAERVSEILFFLFLHTKAGFKHGTLHVYFCFIITIKNRKGLMHE